MALPRWLVRLVGQMQSLFIRPRGILQNTSAQPDDTFAARYHRFKLFLAAWNKLQELMTELELMLCGTHPFGMQTVRAMCTRITTQVFQCMRQLEELAPGRYATLEEPFARIQKVIADSVYGQPDKLTGALTYSLLVSPNAPIPVSPRDVLPDPPQYTEEHYTIPPEEDLIDPALLRLRVLHDLTAGSVPEGFIATATACQRLMNHMGLQEEVSRRVQAAGDARPDNIEDLTASIRELIELAPVPDDVADALLQAVEQLKTEAGHKRHQVLMRGRVWPQGTSGDDGGMTLWGPSFDLHTASRETILSAFKKTVALKYSPQASIYRRYRGLRDAGTCVCVACFAVDAPVAGGVAYTANPLFLQDGSIHVHAGRGLPEQVEDGATSVDVYHICRSVPHQIRLQALAEAKHPVLSAEQAYAIANLALEVEAHYQHRQEIDWLLEPDGTLLLLHTRPLSSTLPATEEDGDDEEVNLPTVLAQGGITVSPGVASGIAHVVRTPRDIATFPDGGVLVVERPLAQWGMLLDRACAVVAEQGSPANQLASIAREFGKPAVFSLHNATAILAHAGMVTVSGDTGVIYPDYVHEIVDAAKKPRNFIPGSPVHQALSSAAHHILPLTFDPESSDFKARNCTTFHDIGRYCQEHAVGEMFRFGSQQAYAVARVKQLQCDVPKQFWVINLDDAFPADLKGPFIPATQLASAPFAPLWRGMNAIPWEGPPPVDAKGFLSVMFEATANPHLDPAAQSAFFSEKNYFMASRTYCSLHSRFGFHFVAVEALISERMQENHIVFHLRGGAANIERRILRVEFVAELLQHFGFTPTIRRDALSARLEGRDAETIARHLKVAGYLTIHTRQMDMIMADTEQLALRRQRMIDDCTMLRDEPLTNTFY